MQAGYNPHRAIALLVGAALAVFSACAPQVRIVLVAADDLQATPEFLRFEFADLTTSELERFGPYATTGMPSDEFTAIAPEHVFVIGAIGCKTATEADCLEPQSFLAQGCTGEETLARGEEATLEITLHSADVGAVECGINEVID